jgi:hypothetical protein
MDHDQERTDGTAPPPAREAQEAGRLAAWVGAFAVVLVEMSRGMRPATTLDPVATPAARRRIHRVVSLGGELRTGRRVAPVRVIGVRGMQPTAGAYEAAVTLGIGARSIAVAARVEHDGEAWRIVDLAPPGLGLLPAGRRPGRPMRSDRPPTRG